MIPVTIIPPAQIPKVKLSKSFPAGTIMEFNYTPNTYYFLREKQMKNTTNTHEIARELYGHMEIVKESRELIKDGKAITWEHFTKTHAARRKK